MQFLVGPSLSEALVRRSTSPLSWPSDFGYKSLNRRLTASCFVVSAHSVRWTDTHDACGSCRPKVCLPEVVELQKRERNSCKKLLGTGTRKTGQIWSQIASVACSQYKTWACTCAQWMLPSQLELLGWDLPLNLFGAPSTRALVYQQVTGKWVVQRLRWILEKQSLWHNVREGWKGSDFGRRELQQDLHEFNLAKATPMPTTSVDVRCMHVDVSHSLAISCKQQGSPCLPYSLMTSRLYFVSCTPTTPTSLYTRKSVQAHPRKYNQKNG